MENKFKENLKKLTNQYSQRYIAEKTGFSQSSINNYLTKDSEPSIQFLIALKNAFSISVDDFLFTNYESKINVSYDRYIGNYMVYYYNNNSYKGEIHTNLKNTLNYGVISIFKENNGVKVYSIFTKDRVSATKLLKEVNEKHITSEAIEVYKNLESCYVGGISFNEQNLFFELINESTGDHSYIILNNPPTKTNYIGGVGTVNSVSRGREHNPCVQYIILSKYLLDKPDGEIYNCLNLDDYFVNLDDAIKDVIDLFKRLYVENNELSLELTDEQKNAIIQNKLEYYFYEILQANVFRFSKISNKEDDAIYNLIRESADV